MTTRNIRLCSIAGCARKFVARGMCGMHYQRWKCQRDMQAPIPRARGEGSISRGYLIFGEGGRNRREHVLIAEKALGKKLPNGAVVHHADGNSLNNDPDNLVICPNQGYHRLLHRRLNAFTACGNADWRKCVLCKVYDSPENVARYGGRCVHKACAAKKERERRRIKSHLSTEPV